MRHRRRCAQHAEGLGHCCSDQEDLLLKASIGITERLKEWVKAYAGCDDIEPCKEVVVGKSDGALFCTQ